MDFNSSKAAVDRDDSSEPAESDKGGEAGEGGGVTRGGGAAEKAAVGLAGRGDAEAGADEGGLGAEEGGDVGEEAPAAPADEGAGEGDPEVAPLPVELGRRLRAPRVRLVDQRLHAGLHREGGDR